MQTRLISLIRKGVSWQYNLNLNLKSHAAFNVYHQLMRHIYLIRDSSHVDVKMLDFRSAFNFVPFVKLNAPKCHPLGKIKGGAFAQEAGLES